MHILCLFFFSKIELQEREERKEREKKLEAQRKKEEEKERLEEEARVSTLLILSFKMLRFESEKGVYK